VLPSACSLLELCWAGVAEVECILERLYQNYHSKVASFASSEWLSYGHGCQLHDAAETVFFLSGYLHRGHSNYSYIPITVRFVTYCRTLLRRDYLFDSII
jgi:hypothetical protein